MPIRRISGLLLCGSIVCVFLNVNCQKASDRGKYGGMQDSLRRDTTRPMNNPYKMGQGNDQYDRQREALGNLDSLVTPQQPGVPGR